MNKCVTLEAGKYGVRAILHSRWSARIGEYFKRHGVVELQLNMGKGWRGQDLSFLSGLPHLKAFEILDLCIKDVGPIHCLKHLKRLQVTTYCSTKIDFGVFPELESCSLEWRPKATSLFDCVTLKALFLNRFKGKSTAPFAKLVNLESLQILNSPVQDLQGLTGVKKLRYLRLGNLRCISSLAGIEQLTALETLDINTCRGFHSIEQVGALTNLRRLELNNCGNIESLEPLDNLSKLEAVGFYESTDIVDGDLSPLLRQKHLSSCSFQNRRHYSHRREEFSAYS